MGKSKNKRQYYALDNERLKKLQEEIAVANTMRNLLQEKHTQLKKDYAAAQKRIKVQENLIAELEEMLSDAQ